MAEMGSGYGSECHLLRYLGRHRQRLDEAVTKATGAETVGWLDYQFDSGRKWQDAEWKGLDFLGCRGNSAAAETNKRAMEGWRTAWPQRGNVPNWDAVGIVTMMGKKEWLLVEAKANCEELRSSCKAQDEGGRPLIKRTLAATKERLGVSPDKDWLDGYYQYANRIAVLKLLNECGVSACLLNIYFTGDSGDAQRTCPADDAGWRESLALLKTHIGLPVGHALESRMHELFLPVCPTDTNPHC